MVYTLYVFNNSYNKDDRHKKKQILHNYTYIWHSHIFAVGIFHHFIIMIPNFNQCSYLAPVVIFPITVSGRKHKHLQPTKISHSQIINYTSRFWQVMLCSLFHKGWFSIKNLAPTCTSLRTKEMRDNPAALLLERRLYPAILVAYFPQDVDSKEV